MNESDLNAPDDSTEMPEFINLARTALRFADPAPAEVTELAKLGFEFRPTETAEVSDNELLVGVRSATATDVLQAQVGDCVLAWGVEDSLLSGVANNLDSSHSLFCQTPEAEIPIEVEADSGTFECAAPTGPYRLVLRSGEQSWATRWDFE